MDEMHATFQLGVALSRQIEEAQRNGGEMPDWLRPQGVLRRDGMIVAVSGSRTFTDSRVVEKVVERLIERQVRVIVGDAPSGVDLMVRQALHGVSGWDPDHDVFKAHWKYEGKGAGKARNERLIQKAGELIAIFAPGERTPGTQDALERAAARRIPIAYYHEGNWRYLPGDR